MYVRSSKLSRRNRFRDQGGPGRKTQNCLHFWVCVGFSRREGVNSCGGPGREALNCHRFWTCVGSSRPKSVNSLKSNAKLSLLLDSHGVFASQNCQKSQGSGGPGRETHICRHFWVCVGFSRLEGANNHRHRYGPCCETQNCLDFWVCVGFSRLKCANS